ncbi:hypothetical protein Q5705_07525 [Kosakonia sp. H02]|nr:hypothetical protein Q5705_07525 [Kosakonia sp. H02]
MAQDIVFNSPSWLPVVLYYLLSLAIVFGLMLGKVNVNRKHSRLLFIFYTLFVFGIGAIQFCLAIHGTSFLKGFLHINYDIDDSYSIRFGAFAFALLSFVATPRNKYR